MRFYSGLYVVYIFFIGLAATSSETDNEVSFNLWLETNVGETSFYIYSTDPKTKHHLNRIFYLSIYLHMFSFR